MAKFDIYQRSQVLISERVATVEADGPEEAMARFAELIDHGDDPAALEPWKVDSAALRKGVRTKRGTELDDDRADRVLITVIDDDPTYTAENDLEPRTY